MKVGALIFLLSPFIPLRKNEEDGAAEIVANAEAEAELLPDEDHDDAAGDAVNRQNGFD